MHAWCWLGIYICVRVGEWGVQWVCWQLLSRLRAVPHCPACTALTHPSGFFPSSPSHNRPIPHRSSTQNKHHPIHAPAPRLPATAADSPSAPSASHSANPSSPSRGHPSRTAVSAGSALSCSCRSASDCSVTVCSVAQEGSPGWVDSSERVWRLRVRRSRVRSARQPMRVRD